MIRESARGALLAGVLALLACGAPDRGESQATRALEVVGQVLTQEMMSRPDHAISPESRRFLRDANAALGAAQSPESAAGAAADLAAAAVLFAETRTAPGPPLPDASAEGARSHLDELPAWGTLRGNLERIARDPDVEAPLAAPLENLITYLSSS